jgi:hypothetical protein
MRSAQPSSAGAKSPTVGVPSPPNHTGCSVPGMRLCTIGSPACRSAQWATMWSRRVSARIRACSLASAAVRVAEEAANSASSFSNTLSIYGSAPTLFRDLACHKARDNTGSIRTTRAIQRRRPSPASGARNQKVIALRPTDIERFATQGQENQTFRQFLLTFADLCVETHETSASNHSHDRERVSSTRTRNVG